MSFLLLYTGEDEYITGEDEYTRFSSELRRSAADAAFLPCVLLLVVRDMCAVSGAASDICALHPLGATHVTALVWIFL